jgi:formylmethanofuran dehydrogenase subunit E-like metal-binding protein
MYCCTVQCKFYGNFKDEAGGIVRDTVLTMVGGATFAPLTVTTRCENGGKIEFWNVRNVRYD